jgi:hypothetical protein
MNALDSEKYSTIGKRMGRKALTIDGNFIYGKMADVGWQLRTCSRYSRREAEDELGVETRT